MQNGVHRGKKPETEAKSKNRVMAKKLTSITSVYPQTQPHRTNLYENISEGTVFIKDVQNTVTSCHNFQEYFE